MSLIIYLIFIIINFLIFLNFYRKTYYIDNSIFLIIYLACFLSYFLLVFIVIINLIDFINDIRIDLNSKIF